MENRVKAVRVSLGLTQSDFGEKLGLSRDVIKNLENNRVDLKPHVAKLIALTFNVNEQWLLTGEGFMKEPDAPDLLHELLRRYRIPKHRESIMRGFARLDPEQQSHILDFVRGYAAGVTDSQQMD